MESPNPGISKDSSSESLGITRSRSTRGRKRKRLISESSSDIEDVLPENTLEVEKNLHASAVKNNLDDVSVKKILKKVVTNDHVLALVKLREEEEKKAMKIDNMQPKLTRAKVKELMKVSPKTAPWNLENLELTPIKHIPVKTRPEVKALITQELQDDEDDEEYEPTNDDVPSDDDHTLESCSDVDSQPRTPATPRRFASPRAVKDGPFKVPQEISTPRRKLNLDEDATIALRTRSKLSLSSIPIDHIESSFVPPDELPTPVVDDIWTEFLQECMNPEASKNEDDDDDPEYNVAADPDAHDEDEEGLENIIKISKKELNDLVTELFNIMPETTADDLTGKLASEIAAQSNTQVPAPCVSKQEPLSDEDANQPPTVAPMREQRMSIGKSEPVSEPECEEEASETAVPQPTNNPPQPVISIVPQPVTVSVLEGTVAAYPQSDKPVAPTPIQKLLISQKVITVQVEQGVEVLPEQVAILQQQIRMHVQLATTNYLQLYIHPVHWELAPIYREYLETLNKMTTGNPDSVANVCNLKPALALINSWQEAVSADTPENSKMVEFIQKEVDRNRRRAAQNSLYEGSFHETFMDVIANSSVFLYPHLLPPLPYRTDGHKRSGYLRSEDELIALAVDEFWQYIEDNKELFKVPTRPTTHRWGLVATVQQITKHMLPWFTPKALLSRIQFCKKSKDPDHPIRKLFANREVTPVQHTLIPFNPNITLYEQPEHELPRVWVRHLAKSSERFKKHYYRTRPPALTKYAPSKQSPYKPEGVPVELGDLVTPPKKNPLPISFNKEIVSNRLNVLPPIAPKELQDKFDIEIEDPNSTPSSTPNILPALYSVVQTPSGAYLVPLPIVTTNTVDSASTPISSVQVQETVASNLPEESNVPTAPHPPLTQEHCDCCELLRKITKKRQTFITDYFKPKVKTCPCKEKRMTKYPKISRKLLLLVNNYKSKSYCAWQGLLCRLQSLTTEIKKGLDYNLSEAMQYELEEIVAVTMFQLRLTIRTVIARNNKMKIRINTLLSTFHPDKDDPYVLFDRLDNAFAVECVDMYKEFLGFLTVDQADRMGWFLDYFKQEYLTDLMKRIEEQVPNKRHKLNILIKLRQVLTNRKLTPCEICTAILGVLKYYPKLASHVFDLFPHRRLEKEVLSLEAPKCQPIMPKPSEQQEKETETTQCADSQPKDNAEEGEKMGLDKEEEVGIDKDREIGKDKDGDMGLDKDGEMDIEKNGEMGIESDRETGIDSGGETGIDKDRKMGIDKDGKMGIDKDGEMGIESDRETGIDEDGEMGIESGGETDIDKDRKIGIDKGGEMGIESDRETGKHEDGEMGIKSGGETGIDKDRKMSIDKDWKMGIDKDGKMGIDNDREEEETAFDESQAMDYEADLSESDDERSRDNLTIIENPDEINNTVIKREEYDTSHNLIDTPHLTVTKTEVQDYSESESSVLVTLEDVTVKSESQEWKRAEDRLLLEVLKQSLTPEERKDMTVLDMIEDKNVLQAVSDSLPHKSLDGIRERIMYLLEFLQLNKD